jgi:hypothetical protein
MKNKPITASEMGKKGGAKKSAAKTKACRENAKKPRKRLTKHAPQPLILLEKQK